MRWPPRIVVIAPRIRSRLDGHKCVAAVCVRHRSAGAGEVGIEWRRVGVLGMRVASRSVRLPDFDQAVRHRVAISVQYATTHDDAFSQRITPMLNREIVFIRTDGGM